MIFSSKSLCKIGFPYADTTSKIEIDQQLWSCCENEGEEFLQNIVTVNKTWLYDYDTETVYGMSSQSFTRWEKKNLKPWLWQENSQLQFLRYELCYSCGFS